MTENTARKSIAGTKSHDINIAQIVGALIDNRWLIIAIIALSSCIGIVYSLFSTPVYQADALVQVEKILVDLCSITCPKLFQILRLSLQLK